MKDFEISDFEQIDTEFDDRSAEEMYAEFLSTVEKPKGEFIYIYAKYYDVMTSLTAAAMNLMTWMTFHCEVNTGRVLIQSETLKIALEELGITLGTYYKSMALLKEIGMVKGSNAKYFVNPAFAWKGNAENRNKFLRVYNRF